MYDKKWQYKVETIKLGAFSSPEKHDGVLQDRLTRLGMEGWDLVSTLSYGTSVRLFLKR